MVGGEGARTPLSKDVYGPELERLQRELVKLQAWVQHEGLRLCVVFEGRDTAGKGGVIKRIVEHTNPRIVRVTALPRPTDRERSAWYYQRYVAHLPAAGEIVLFDRSWYNRAGVERVMGFCTDAEYQTFLRTCPRFEDLLLDEGITLVKYWLMVSAEEQERRFRERIDDPTKRWKLSEMDLLGRAHWFDYERAEAAIFEHTDTDRSPWWLVDAEDQRRARLNCISHLLSLVPYEDLTSDPVTLPPLQERPFDVNSSEARRRWVPDRF
jgi:polyphosphate kinase 2